VTRRVTKDLSVPAPASVWEWWDRDRMDSVAQEVVPGEALSDSTHADEHA
jgi:hypothetical protein